MRRLQAVALGLLLAAGCAGDADSGSPGTGGRADAGAGTGGSGAAGGRGGTSGGAGPGSGGSGAGAGGSSSVGGSGGSTGGTGGSGTGGGAADAGPSDSAAVGDAGPTPPDAAAAPCKIEVLPLSPPRLFDLSAAPGQKLRVIARATGSAVPAVPLWRWTITHASGEVIPHSAVEGDEAVVEFATEMIGQYTVNVEMVNGGGLCQPVSTAAGAILPSQRVTKFRILATPPAGRDLVPLETDVLVMNGTSAVRTIEFQPGFRVTVDAQDERGLALPAYYVQIRSRSTTARIERYVDTRVPAGRMGLQAQLDASNPQDPFYDVLLVPDAVSGAIPRAPIVFPRLAAPADFQLRRFVVEAGVAVSGTVRNADAPLAGARVRLRAGLLPSTVGQSDAGGGYRLLARDGRFEVRVLPPADSGLPEAQLPESAGLDIPGGVGSYDVDFSYAPLPQGRLDLTVVTPDSGTPARPVTVLLESLEGELDSVGTFMLPSGPRGARGLVRLQRDTGTGGVLSFARLPRARYQVTLIPPADLPGNAAITTVGPIDLGMAANGAVVRTVALARRTRILGKLTPAGDAANLTVRALDSADDGISRAVTALVGADGSYQLPVDPGRVYRLFVEPPADRRLPRVPLVPVRARTTDVNDQQALPRRLSVQGTTRGADGMTMGGVNLQIFCVGAAPDCIDTLAPDISNTPPIDETTSASDGKYQLYVPDPGS